MREQNTLKLPNDRGILLTASEVKYTEVLANGIDNKSYFGFNIAKISFIIS